MGFIKEFKEFAMKGNVMDMAVGVIIGGAFGKIVTSLVNDVLMPLIGMITGNIDFTSLSFKIGEGEDAAVLAYGNFIRGRNRKKDALSAKEINRSRLRFFGKLL